MGCISWIFVRKLTALLRHRTVFTYPGGSWWPRAALPWCGCFQGAKMSPKCVVAQWEVFLELRACQTAFSKIYIHIYSTCCCMYSHIVAKTNGCRQFPDDIFMWIFLNEESCILIPISLKCVPVSPIDNKSALVSIMASGRTGDKPVLDPMLTHIHGAIWCS